MAVFKVAHVSDLHFGGEPRRANIHAFAEGHDQAWTRREVFGALKRLHRQGTHDPLIAERAAMCLLENAKDQSLLIISGDLAATGLSADLDAALAFLEAPSSPRLPYRSATGQATLSAGRFGMMVIPGNHDRYRSHLGAAGGTDFDSHFARYWGQPHPRVGRRVLRHPNGTERLAFVSADLCLAVDADAEQPVYVNRYGQGRATRHVVDLLELETEKVRAKYDGVGVCWVVHFPTTLSGTKASASMKLVDGHLVVDAAKRQGIGLILCGHVHESVLLSHDEVQLCCAGSATYYKEPNGNFVHFLEIDVTDGHASLVAKRDFQWNDRVERFVEKPRDVTAVA